MCVQQLEILGSSDLSGLTPLMKQYIAAKTEYPDSLLLFQVGDFYEMFFDDAKKVSQFLGITLTKRGMFNGQPIPLCGFPIHALDHYIPRLVKGGFKLALCDQLEAATAGKMVARGVTNVLTPGMLTAENLLDAKSQSYLFSFFPTKIGYGLLFSELLTSQLHATVLPHGASRQLEVELFRFLPDEVLLLKNRAMTTYDTFFKQRGFFTTQFDALLDQANVQEETDWFAQNFDEKSVHLLQEQSSLLYASILWKKYVQKNQQQALSQFKSITMYEPESFLMLDSATQKNLDLVKNGFDGSRNHTLFGLMDKAITPMGSRMIKRWLLSPVMDMQVINQRHDAIEELLSNGALLEKVQELLSGCGDVQRVVGRIALDKAAIRDYVGLRDMLLKIPQLSMLLVQCRSELLKILAQGMYDFTIIQQLLDASLQDDLGGTGIIKKGFNARLDVMRDLVENGSVKILELEQKEVAKTGIQSLKIRQNNIQGYYIEITKTHTDAIPADYIEQQSLVGRKRFTTKELQILQFQILQAQQQFAGMDKELFNNIKLQVKDYVGELRQTSQSLAQLDGLVGFVKVAYEYGWVRPEFGKDQDIIIEQGKHPIIAASLGAQFIANDTKLIDSQSLLIITGPNMGGKSTYLRQVALICLLGQCGSFVPARRARLSILDRIFTRIGAGDFLAQGKSTFLVEMEETAQILHSATQNSLVILDEVGRGTSTYDGIALAQAIIEYIFCQLKSRCLFATHYHELTDLQQQYSGIVSYFADSVRTAQGIVFLHKIIAGKADGSFGLEVAKLANIPSVVVNRASKILSGLHGNGSNLSSGKTFVAASSNDEADGGVEPHRSKNDCAADSKNLAVDAIIDRLQSIDCEQMSSKQAFDLVWELKALLKQKE